MEHVLGGGEWMAAYLWGMRSVVGLDFSFYFPYPTPTYPCIFNTCYPPIFSLPLHVSYFPALPPCLCIFNTLLGAACPSPVQGLVVFVCLMCEICLMVCLLNRWLVLVWCIVYLVSSAVRIG